MSLLTYTFAQLKAAAAFRVGATASGDLDTGSTLAQVVNRAMSILAGEKLWAWRRSGLVLSFVAGAITSIARATNVVTVTRNAHGFGAGDFVRITGADSSFNGEFYVASAVTNSFTFLQTGSDETAAVPGSVIGAGVALPADFVALHEIERVSAIRSLFPTSIQYLNRLRTVSGVYSVGPVGHFYCVRWRPQVSVTAVPQAWLELYPTPTAAETAAIVGTYVRDVPMLSGSTDVADVPAGAFQQALYTLCMAMAQSSEEERAGEDWRLYERQLSRLKEEDGSDQPNLGPIEGGVDQTSFGIDPLYPVQIGVST